MASEPRWSLWKPVYLELERAPIMHVYGECCLCPRMFPRSAKLCDFVQVGASLVRLYYPSGPDIIF
jgi:uncharacterized protein YjaG (DUF416 family)